MLVSDLRQGDVLLFETEPGVVIDDLIVLLTGSIITHAAICYRVPGVLADAYPPKIALHALADIPAGRGVHVKRLGGAHLPMGPVVDAADVYVTAKEPYDMPGLVMLGLLLLYKHAKPISSITQGIVFQLLKRLASQLDKLFAKGQHPMVCSEFVYQCYADAAAKDARYALAIKGGDLQVANTARTSLLERAAARRMAASREAEASVLEGAMDSTASDDELLARLLEALRNDADSLVEDVPLHSQLVDVIQSIADLFHAHAPKTLATEAPDAMSYLLRQSSFFVTPGDLYAHCPSLVDQGIVNAKREDADWHPG